MDAEKLRRQYFPRKVITLFVGESPPPTGDTFFYRENSQVYEYLKEVLSAKLQFTQENNFLETFKMRGCYLDDLAPLPISEYSKVQLDGYIDDLASRISRYKPKVVVTILKRIGPSVDKAIRRSKHSPKHFVVSFPGNGQQQRFRDEMKDVIASLPDN